MLELFHVEQFSVNCGLFGLNGNNYGFNCYFLLLAEEQDALGAFWQGLKWLPVELGGLSGHVLEFRGVREGGQDGEPAGWGEELDCGGDGGFHFVYGAEGYAVEFLF